MSFLLIFNGFSINFPSIFAVQLLHHHKPLLHRIVQSVTDVALILCRLEAAGHWVKYLLEHLGYSVDDD
ncbi:hypothetical protein D3C79_892070 [compost metagenome]